MPQTIFVTGGSGFVGRALIAELLSRGYAANALTHRRGLEQPGVRQVSGDIGDPASIQAAMSGCSAVIHLVGIIREHPRKGVTFRSVHFEGAKNVIEAAKRAGIRRFLHMSALGVRADAQSEYHKTKFAAEGYLRQSGLDWTIFRPSLIHGPGGELMRMEAAWARKRAMPYLFMPWFGGGFWGQKPVGRVQPIFVKDVTRAFVDAIDKPNAIGKAYDLGGPEKLTWPEFHRAVALAIVGKRRWTLGMPAWKARLLSAVLPRWMLPFNRDQVIMSLEDNTCDIEPFAGDFGWRPRGLAQTLAEYER